MHQQRLRELLFMVSNDRRRVLSRQRQPQPFKHQIHDSPERATMRLIQQFTRLFRKQRHHNTIGTTSGLFSERGRRDSQHRKPSGELMVLCRSCFLGLNMPHWILPLRLWSCTGTRSLSLNSVVGRGVATASSVNGQATTSDTDYD